MDIRLYMVLCFCASTTAQDHYIYFSKTTGILRRNLNTSTTDTVISDQERVVALDFDIDQQYLFWTDVTTRKIYRSSLVSGTATGEPVSISRASTPDGLAVDWVLNHVYWTDTGYDEIMVSNYDGSVKRTLINNGLEEPRAIALHIENGYMFWTDWGRYRKIERSSMDGSFRSTIVTRNLYWPNGLTIDFSEERIYWIDGRLLRIDSAKFDGTDTRNVVETSSYLDHPFSIAVHGENLYYSDWGEYYYRSGSGIKRMAKSGGYSGYVYSSSSYKNVFDLKIYNQDAQAAVTSRLSYLATLCQQCPYLCLPRQHSGDCLSITCTCADGVSCDKTYNTTCQTDVYKPSPVEVVSIHTSSSSNDTDNASVSSDDDDDLGLPVLIGLMVACGLCGVLGTLVVVLCVRQKVCKGKDPKGLKGDVKSGNTGGDGLYDKPGPIRKEPSLMVNIPQIGPAAGTRGQKHGNKPGRASSSRGSVGNSQAKTNLPMTISDLDYM